MAAATATSDSLSILHHIPGRLRVRVPAGAPSEGLVEAVAALRGVRSASWSPRTRGLLVLHDPAETNAAEILSVVAEHTATEPTPMPAMANGTRPTLAAAVTSLGQELNTRVVAKTGGFITLGALVPMALLTWAATEVIRGRTGPLAWSSALWYAHGLFRDYNVPSREG